MSPDKSGGRHICSGDGCRFRDVEPLAARRIGTFFDTVHLSDLKSVHHVPFVDRGIQCHCQYHIKSLLILIDQHQFSFDKSGRLKHLERLLRLAHRHLLIDKFRIDLELPCCKIVSGQIPLFARERSAVGHP